MSAVSAVTAASARLSGGLLVVVQWTVLIILIGPVHASGESDPGGVWPLDPQPRIARGFAPPPDPWRAGHRGVDLAGRAGQVVRAAAGGEVLMAGALAGMPLVVVDHGATRTTYQPVLASVQVGDRVEAGSAIGSLGVAGSHCSPQACLHWGLIRNGTQPPEYLDPLSLVGSRPVRLLPLTGRAAPPEATLARSGARRSTPPLLLRPRMGLFERSP